MGNGNKKNKRPSSLTSPKTELIERTPDNDYGVLSDPEENTPSTPVPLLAKGSEEVEEATQPASLEMKTDDEPTTTTEHSQPQQQHDDNVCSHTPSDPSPTSHSTQQPSPSLQPLSQEQSPTLQPPTLETQTSKSLGALQLKLSVDKNFSKKITLHTFFSYIILAIEMQRASSASISIAHTSPEEVQELIKYMIEHHTATQGVKTYLHTLIETGVIKNLIEAIIEFNKDQTDALDKLLTEEQNELEMTSAEKTSSPANIDIVVDASLTTSSSDQAQANQSPQTSQKCGFFKRLRCFFSGCCG
jgi:hypothetical protein